MTYMDWIDELCLYLAELPKEERRQVLNYYAEIYADMRDAGKSEEEILKEFGLPKQAAERVKNERADGKKSNPFSDFYQHAKNWADETAQDDDKHDAGRHNPYAQGGASEKQTTPAVHDDDKAPEGKSKYRWVIWVVVVLLIFTFISQMITCMTCASCSFIMDAYAMETYETSVSDLTDLNVDIAFGKVEMVADSGIEHVKIYYPRFEHVEYTVTTTGKAMNYTMTTPNFYPYSVINVPTTTIRVPTRQMSGIVLTLTMNAGTLTMKYLTFSDISITQNAGISELKYVDSLDDFTILMNAGKLTASNAHCKKMTSEVNAGAIEMSSLVCPDVKLKTNAGSIKCEIAGNKSDYNTYCSVTLGSCNLANSTDESRTKRLEATVDLGSINVEFMAMP